LVHTFKPRGPIMTDTTTVQYAPNHGTMTISISLNVHYGVMLRKAYHKSDTCLSTWCAHCLEAPRTKVYTSVTAVSHKHLYDRPPAAPYTATPPTYVLGMWWAVQRPRLISFIVCALWYTSTQGNKKIVTYPALLYHTSPPWRLHMLVSIKYDLK
jgi:hypothetical protein